MFSKKFQRKYALTDQGVENTKKGAFWTVIVNLVVMGGVGILYLLMSGFMETPDQGSASARDSSGCGTGAAFCPSFLCDPSAAV